jgi:hypothetical protein
MDENIIQFDILVLHIPQVDVVQSGYETPKPFGDGQFAVQGWCPWEILLEVTLRQRRKNERAFVTFWFGVVAHKLKNVQMWQTAYCPKIVELLLKSFPGIIAAYPADLTSEGLATDFDADERAHLSASNDMIILIQDFVSNQFVPFAMKVLFAVQRPPVFVDLRAIELDEVVVI